MTKDPDVADMIRVYLEHQKEVAEALNRIVTSQIEARRVIREQASREFDILEILSDAHKNALLMLGVPEETK